MSPLDVIVSLTAEQGLELAASAAALLGAAYVGRVIIKLLK